MSAMITGHQLAIILGSIGGTSYVVTAAISTMPAKDAQWNWRTLYGWFFDFAHMLINSRHPA